MYQLSIIYSPGFNFSNIWISFSGLVPGDQLLEVDGHNVTSMSLESVCTLARRSRQSPPTVGVVSRIQYAELIASRRWGYGMTLRGVRPTYVDGVDPHGPAYHAGIRPGQCLISFQFGFLTITYTVYVKARYNSFHEFRAL